MPLPNTAIYSHVTFDGHLDDPKVIEEIVLYVRAAANGPVNIRIVEHIDDTEKATFYTAWIDGNKLWINRRHHHLERRKEVDRRVTPRETERRNRNNRRYFDIGHMPKPLAVVKEKPADKD